MTNENKEKDLMVLTGDDKKALAEAFLVGKIFYSGVSYMDNDGFA